MMIGVMDQKPVLTKISAKDQLKKAPRHKKVYINLRKLSNLFNDEGLKPYLSNFLSGPFLRYLSTSTTK